MRFSIKDAEDGKSVRYKYCVVPRCRSSTRRTPHKLFLSMPRGEARHAWLAAMGRGPQHRALSLTCNRFCCEDHFNLEEDMINYLQWKLMGRKETKKLMLRKGVVPHKFDCQTETASNPQVEEQKQLISEKTEEEQLEMTLDLRRAKIKKINNRKRKVTEEKNLQDKKIKMISPVLDEELISEQKKKLEKISNVSNEADVISQNIEELGKYTFQVKIEAEEVEEEPNEELIPENFINDLELPAEESSILLDVNVKVEELDEEFEPEVIKEEVQVDVIAD
ncbi:uncharacterized protein LOC112056287 isoform X4 [Bicyclus anynana]|uniref:Uncharacterized protein LOC112056287 isoform X4 n=1 Tax=Bicyclus anynana TaxID=110368 RepID=A0ABM3LRL1_BICAN|nr:uncharacterized protein LOC112056287 isoform X4 [Bicyclus anynana]